MPYKIESLLDVLAVRAHEDGDKTAYIFLRKGEPSEEIVTYGRFYEMSQAFAALLAPMIVPGNSNKCLLLIDPSIQYIVAFFGCLMAGAIPIPAYPVQGSHGLARLRSIIDDAKPKLAVIREGDVFPIEEQMALQTQGCSIVHIPSLDQLNSDRRIASNISQDDCAFIQYTSGSTSHPKGVLVSHKNILSNLQAIASAFKLNKSSVGAIWLPPFHDMGLIGGILQPLFTGFPVILMSPLYFLQKPVKWLSAISKYRATCSGGPNFAFETCVEKIREEDCQDLDLSCWQTAFVGAEPIRQLTLDRFVERFSKYGFRRDALLPCYGLAEATLLVTARSGLYLDNDSHAISCGQPISGTQIIICDAEKHTRLGEGETGEIWIAGDGVAGGYWNRPEETQATFHAQLPDDASKTYLRTGDLGYIKNSELFVTGRIKDLIIIRGTNRYPQDIEHSVEGAHYAIRRASVAAFSTTVQMVEGLTIVAEIERAHLSADLNAIAEIIREAIIEEHRIVAENVLLTLPGQLPRTSSGKLQRHLAKKMFIEKEFKVLLES